MKVVWFKNFMAVLSLCLSVWLPSVNAEPNLNQDLQTWNTVTLRAGFGPGKRILGYLEAQPRIGNLDSSGTKKDDFSQLILRPAVGYQINPHVSVWQGYAWIPTFQPRSRIENRIFQQLQLEGHLKKLRLTNRSRLEQRWIEGTDHTAVRFRNMTRAAYPLGKSQHWSLVGSDEFFVNLNTVENGPQGGFDQNRIFVGMNRKLNQHLNAEAGYLNDLVHHKGPTPERMNHIIVFTLNVTI